MEKNNSDISRREFIIRSIKAGSAIVVTGTIAAILYDSKGPQVKEKQDIIKLPDYTIKPIKGKTISIVKGKKRSQTLQKAFDLLGGLSRFIVKGDKVLIKPNIAFATSPTLGATTHPEIITTMIDLCFKAGASKVSILDNPINDPASCYLLTGIEDAVKNTKADLILPKENLFRNMTLKNGKLIKNWPLLYKPLIESTKVIGLAPIKNHHRSGASMSMKNWYGLLGGRRNVFHQDINTIVTELAMMIRPTLVVLDGFDVMMTNGPTGGSISDLKQKNTIIVSTDQVAADTVGAGLLNLKSKDLPYLSMAERAGVGSTNYKNLKPILFNEA